MAKRETPVDSPASLIIPTLTPACLAEEIRRLPEEDAITVPLLDEAARMYLLEEIARLPFRRARQWIGEGERRVEQDFDLTTEFPLASRVARLAASLSSLLHAACRRLDPCPLAPDFLLNDLIAQRYPAGSRGISAHRDHVRYKGLVAIINLAGQARFFVCNDRRASKAREIPIPAGSLNLMRAPGFAGRLDRPFHFLKDVSCERVSVGLRYDTRPGMPL